MDRPPALPPTQPKPVTTRDWSVRRHRRRPRGLGVTRALASGLAVVGLLAGGAATADLFGIRTVVNHTAIVQSWQAPAQVSKVPPAAPPLKVPADAPTNLRIPAIAVNTTLEAIGLNGQGQLNPPAYTDAGWYAGGTEPGDQGPAVIAGHYDAKTPGTPSVFYRLADLKPGDAIEVRRAGKWLTFTVTIVASYSQRAFPTTVVYGPTPAPELRLITCGGTYDQESNSYPNNTVVFATEFQQ